MIAVKNAIRCSALVAALVLTSNVLAATPVIDSPTEDFTTTVDFYDYFITASDSPYIFGATGLPTSLSLNPMTGEISGTVTTAGTYTISLSATSSNGTGTATLTLTVVPPPPVITSATTVTGAAGTPFTYQITTTQGTPDGFYISDYVPGLDFDSDKGLIFGTPTVGGNYVIGIDAYNDGGDCFVLLTINITGPKIAITSDLTAQGKVGDSFEYDVFTDGEDYADFTITGLPSGLIADGAVISGTPTTEGTFNVSITATSVNGNTDTKTLVLTISPKNGNLGPDMSPITADPQSAFVGDTIVFDVDAFDAEGNDVSVSWDFGDGSPAGSGYEVQHAYAAAGTFTVTAKASDGTQTSTQTLNVTITVGDVNAPTISGITITPNPAAIGQAVAFTSQAVDPKNVSLKYTWNFGDGTPSASGSAPSHTYVKQGAFNVTLTVRNATGIASRPFTSTVYVFNTTGLDNIFEGDDTTNPLNGLSQTVTGSDGGIFDLSVNLDALNRAAFEVSTDFDGMTRNAVKGMLPVAKAKRPGIFIATTEARDMATRVTMGRARKTLPVSRKELGLPPLVTAEPSDHRLKIKQIKGSFALPPTTNIGGRIVAVPALRAAGKKSKPDSVNASGSIELPVGMDFTQPQSITISVGNLVDKLVLDSKGHGKGAFTEMTLKTKINKKAPLTVAGQSATFVVKLSTAQMVQRGFDTEGVGAGATTKALKIQSAMIIGGVVYALEQPATLKVSGDTATIGGRSGF